MNRAQKKEFVESFHKEIKDAAYMILTDFSGIDVKNMTRLRYMLKDAGANYRVVKNNLLKLAIKGTDKEAIFEHLVGPVAVAYGDSDVVSVAKQLLEISKEIPNLRLKVGILKEKVISAKDIEKIAKIPPRDELLAKFLYLMKAPQANFVGVLHAVVQKMLFVLISIRDKKQGQAS